MPTIAVNLGNVEAYDNLPIGSYYGEIDRITYREAREAGKFPQLMVTYVVTDGDSTGRKSSEFLSLSPKAAFRLKRWFMKFGLGDAENFEVDDESNDLLEPDLIGYAVIFTVKADGERFRTELASVETDVANPEPVAPQAPAPVARRAAAPVAAAPAEDELEDIEEDEAPAAPVAPAPRRVPATPAAPARPAGRPAPQRRTLR